MVGPRDGRGDGESLLNRDSFSLGRGDSFVNGLW